MSNDILSPVAQRYLFLANILSAARIEKVIVPEVVQSGTNITIDCQYHVTDDNFMVLWLHNGNTKPIFKWTPYTLLEVSGVLEGRLDLSYKISRIPREEYRALRILQVEPQLSGEYTCVLLKNGVESRKTKSMLVYNAEQEFELVVNDLRQGFIQITCAAHGLYPQPDLIIEHNKEAIPQQYQRVWHNQSLLYSAESRAQLAASKCREIRFEITCRLHLPQVDYTAIKKRFLHLGNDCNYAWKHRPAELFILLTVLLFFVNKYHIV